MKKKIFLLFILFLIFFSPKVFSKENKILIKLNNEIITTVDISNEIKYLSILNKNFSSITAKKKIEVAKNSLIKQKIKSIEILKYRENLKIKNDIFENILQRYFFDFKIKNLNDFENFFNNRNLNPQFVKKKLLSILYGINLFMINF